MKKVTPEEYFRMLRTFTLRRPQDVLILNSVKNTFQNMTPVQPEKPLPYRSTSWRELSDPEFQALGEVYDTLLIKDEINIQWLIDETEKWCKEEKSTSPFKNLSSS